MFSRDPVKNLIKVAFGTDYAIVVRPHKVGFNHINEHYIWPIKFNTKARCAIQRKVWNDHLDISKDEISVFGTMQFLIPDSL